MQKVQYWLQPCMMLTKPVMSWRAFAVPPTAVKSIWSLIVAFAPLFLLNIHHAFAPAGDDVVHVIRGAMKLLRADHEVRSRHLDQFRAAALRHASEETEDRIRAALLRFRGDVLHFADGLLLRLVADAAGVQQDDVGAGFRIHERIAFGDELRGDCFGVALVHLAAIRLNENTRHRENP